MNKDETGDLVIRNLGCFHKKSLNFHNLSMFRFVNLKKIMMLIVTKSKK